MRKNISPKSYTQTSTPTETPKQKTFHKTNLRMKKLSFNKIDLYPIRTQGPLSERTHKHTLSESPQHSLMSRSRVTSMKQFSTSRLNFNNFFQENRQTTLSDSFYKMQQSTPRIRNINQDDEEIASLKQKESIIHSVSIENIFLLYDARARELKFKKTYKSLKMFLDKFKLNSKHKRFILSEWGLKSECAQIVSNVLTFNNYFFVLDLSKNIIGDVGAQHISDMLRTNTSLVSISLQNNNISSKGAAIICESLLHNKTLTHFDFSSPDGLHRNRMQSTGAQVLKQVLQSNDQLQMMNLSCTSMEPVDIIQLSEGLSLNQELVSLDVSFNGITGQSAIILFRSMVAPCKLRILNVSNNNLGDKSMKTVGEMIELNDGRSRLERLNLSNTQITSTGLAYFLKSAQNNRHLKILKLNHNSFHSPAIVCIQHFLEKSENIIILEMKNCNLQFEAGKAIGQGLQINKKLEQLLIANNSLGDDGIAALSEGLIKNQTLLILELRNNKFNTEGGLAFLENLNDNRYFIILYHLKGVFKKLTQHPT